MKIKFIRHGKCQSNMEKKYLSITQECVCSEGMQELRAYQEQGWYGMVDEVYTSPMIRCRQTAELLYPEQEIRIVKDFRECDFGSLEGSAEKSAVNQPLYKRYLQAASHNPLFDGESPDLFQKRTVAAFYDVVGSMEQDKQLTGMDSQKEQTIALIIHDGTIMAIMGALCPEKENFMEWHVPNGMGYECIYLPEAKQLTVCSKIGVF